MRSHAASSQQSGPARRAPLFAEQLRRAASPPGNESDARTATTRNTPLERARRQIAGRLAYLALLLAALGLLFALEVSACVRYPQQQDRGGLLTALSLFGVIAVGRAIGVWAGLVCCRRSPIGAGVLGVAQVSAIGIAVTAAFDPRTWSAVARFFTADSAAALTGALAALVAALLAGCYRTRRAALPDQ